MSDVTVAPQGAAPSAAPTPSNEVAINPNPTSTPNPIGAQTPDKPLEARSPSAREALTKAFDRANNPPPKGERPQQQARPEPKAAEAKVGHNNPPEEAPRLDLKKRPPPD